MAVVERCAGVPRRRPVVEMFVALWGRRQLLARYCSVSVIATATSQTVLFVLLASSWTSAGRANVVATAVGTVPSFVLNRRWVWGRKDRTHSREVVAFVALSAAGLVLSTLAVSAVAAQADTFAVSAGVRLVLCQMANLAAFGSLWVLQFLVLDRVLFGRRASDDSVVPRSQPSTTSAVEVRFVVLGQSLRASGAGRVGADFCSAAPLFAADRTMVGAGAANMSA